MADVTPLWPRREDAAHDQTYFARELRLRGWSPEYAARMSVPLAELRADDGAMRLLAPILDVIEETIDELSAADRGGRLTYTTTAEDVFMVLSKSHAEPT